VGRLSGSPHARAWCAAEEYSITRGLLFSRKEVGSTLTADASILRAYRPIALVRARAKEASGSFDLDGRHYFAALLHATLAMLKEPVVRPIQEAAGTLFAAQILKKFEKAT